MQRRFSKQPGKRLARVLPFSERPVDHLLVGPVAHDCHRQSDRPQPRDGEHPDPRRSAPWPHDKPSDRTNANANQQPYGREAAAVAHAAAAISSPELILREVKCVVAAGCIGNRDEAAVAQLVGLGIQRKSVAARTRHAVAVRMIHAASRALHRTHSPRRRSAGVSRAADTPSTIVRLTIGWSSRCGPKSLSG